ncbi:MAG: type I glyceraldehyde-3-phosphate dehydrogenase [Patescibacteria group bacterium]|nr:type I glyceraldehyde-3-phosphate dehydrogenase [Patescibacteria group bacterium]
MRIAINGFGRIGRSFFRSFYSDNMQTKNLEIVAINDLTSPDQLKYLLQYDTAYGQAKPEVMSAIEKVKILAEKEPEKLPWKDLGIDLVIESSGRFTKKADAEKHIKAGAKVVVISAPSEDSDITLIPGVNLNAFKPSEHKIISMGSCTTNCLVPMAYVIHKEFEIEKGSFSTTHAFTADQNLVDGPHRKDPRRGRSAAYNIVPTSTGAAKTIFKIFPELKGRISGIALRVPVITVSILDLAVKVKKSIDTDIVNKAFVKYSQKELKNILNVSDKPLVSSDFIHNPASATLDQPLTEVVGNNLIHAISWYDNEWGYSCRLVDLCNYIDGK